MPQLFKDTYPIMPRRCRAIYTPCARSAACIFCVTKVRLPRCCDTFALRGRYMKQELIALTHCLWFFLWMRYPSFAPCSYFEVNLGSPKGNGPKALRGHCLLGNRQICSHDRQGLIEYVHSALQGRINVVIRHDTWWGHIGSDYANTMERLVQLQTASQGGRTHLVHRRTIATSSISMQMLPSLLRRRQSPSTTHTQRMS